MPQHAFPLAAALLLALASVSAHAQTQSPHPSQTQALPPTVRLAQAFEQAWAQQPAALALAERRAAWAATSEAAQAWLAQPGALELRAQTDRPGSDRGAQELELGVALPLWWPGQRSRSQALAAQQAQALDAQLASAQLTFAGELRQAWWAWQRARAEQAQAQAQLDSAQALAADVRRRMRAGELARADAHQADSALAAAQASLARAEGQGGQAGRALQGLLGPSSAPAELAAPAGNAADPLGAEPSPPAGASPGPAPDLGLHPLVREREQQAAAARLAAELADSQARANPELLVGVVHGRDQRGEPRQRQLALGLRLPWGESPAQRAQAANAHAEATELSAQAALLRQRTQAAIDGAQARWLAAQRVLAAAQQRARLAHETQGFFDKSFRLGETDLPTRLRIEQDAQEASRQAALAAIELAEANSALRQAAGLLPQ